MYEGFLPIATPRYLVPKLHKERCVIYPLNNNISAIEGGAGAGAGGSSSSSSSSSSSNVHISKSIKKNAKRFNLTINKDFEAVVKGCHDQHGDGWLYPPIVQAFKKIHDASCCPTRRNQNQNNTTSTSTRTSTRTTKDDKSEYAVRLYSVEVWNAETGDLAGGELGYAVGTMYTSLTGFSVEDGAGSVQLAALGQFLWKEGFDIWDLGMKLDYKKKLGARVMGRLEFVERVKELRGGKMGLMICDEARNCRSIIVDSKREEENK